MRFCKTTYFALIFFLSSGAAASARDAGDLTSSPQIVPCVDTKYYSALKKPDLAEDRAHIKACTHELVDQNDPSIRAQLLYARSIFYYRIKIYMRALSDVEAAARLTPNVPELNLARGAIYTALGLSSLGQREADHAIQMGFAGARAYAIRGATEADMGNFGAAIADLDFALAQSPDDTPSLVARGLSALETGELDEAIHYLDRADSICNCGEGGLYTFRGRAHFALDQYDAALSDFKKAEVLDPGGGAKDYIEDVQDAASTSSNGPTEGKELNADTRPVGNTHSCAAYYPYLSSTLGEEGDVLVHYDVSASGTMSSVGIDQSSGVERLDRAAAICVLHHWRNTPELQNGIAVISPGHRAILKFVAPESSPTDDTRAETLAALGRYDQAIAAYSLILSIDPKNAEVAYRRGLTYYATEDYSNAAHDFDLAAHLKPDMDEAIAGRELANTMHAAKP